MIKGYHLRLYLLTALMLVGFGVLLNRLHSFQIERRDEFLSKVPGNTTETIREPGIRGEIVDRNGVVLARNIRKYEVWFNLEEIRKAYHARIRSAPVKADSGRQKIEDDIVEIVKLGEESPISQLNKLGLAKNFNAGAMSTHYKTHGGLIPFTYRSDLSFEEFATIAEHNMKMPGVDVGIRPQRLYPYGSLGSHVLGYLKQWEKGKIPPEDEKRFDHYIGDDHGIAGVEATMDAYLQGPEGIKKVAKDEKGRTLKMLDYTPPAEGAKVMLTLDAHVQYLVENVLRRTGRAAAVVMDVRTGEVLAMASVPDYDPNAFIPSISSERWQAYLSNKKLSPLKDRAISSYAPGSTMKVPTAIAGALQGMANRSFTCEGFVPYGNHKVGCWLWNMRGGSHGALPLPEAIQRSCNPYFNKLANTMGWEKLVDGCEKVGIGRRTGIHLPGEDPGILPGSRAWKAANPGVSMTPVMGAFTSIGQGDMMATPLQMCAMTACVANGGKYYQPRIIRKVVAQDGEVLLGDEPVVVSDLIAKGVAPEDFELIRQGMWKAVNEPGGTARRTKMEEVEVAAKTGTAQTIDDGEKSNNAWMISFAPYQEPRYAVCVMVQNGASGGAVCGPLTYLIYRGLFAKEGGARLPLRRLAEYSGNTERIEATELPEDVLAAIDATILEEEPIGETGEEVTVLPTEANPPPRAQVVPLTPTITTEADDEGTVVPRAVPVQE
ncbi:MAG: penicillin-binding protein 2 [Akkermansiaceae bacterium]|nr:penicillin-binding protein 2 [Akkermansiaceae bacterium]